MGRMFFQLIDGKETGSVSEYMLGCGASFVRF